MFTRFSDILYDSRVYLIWTISSQNKLQHKDLAIRYAIIFVLFFPERRMVLSRPKHVRQDSAHVMDTMSLNDSAG